MKSFLRFLGVRAPSPAPTPDPDSGISSALHLSWPVSAAERAEIFSALTTSSPPLPSGNSDKHTSQTFAAYLWSTRVPKGGLPIDSDAVHVPSTELTEGEEMWFLVDEGRHTGGQALVIPLHPSFCTEKRLERGKARGAIIRDWGMERLHAEFDINSSNLSTKSLQVPTARLALHPYGTRVALDTATVRAVTAQKARASFDPPAVHPVHGRITESSRLGDDKWIQVTAQYHLLEPWQDVDYKAEMEAEARMSNRD